ncbi:IS21 family transposase [Nucisporomicrobium flavum]|uniref:IS21 family transposase n=1 Tax=Nucisporomicrobium flavum TaxID=2785915 RepID=UPI003C2F7F64
MARSLVEVFEAIRRDHRRGVSIRALAQRYGVHRRTVRAAIDSAAPPPPRKPPQRAAPRLEPFKLAIDAMLRTDLSAPRKQRHTVRRILARLVAENNAGDLSYSTVRDYVARRRPEIAAEAGRCRQEAFILQTHRPGEEAEVDFGELWIRLAGVPTKVFMFALRMSFSGKAVHHVFASQGQEAFIEGHLRAFDLLGGLPTGKIRYDNLRSAVTRVVFGRTRTESDRWVQFRSHMGFEAWYCMPGIKGAHEKGGVEGEVGRFRRNHLVPVPEVATLAELNERIAVIDRAEDDRRLEHRVRTIGQDFGVEQPLLASLPAEPFEPARQLTPKVNRYGLIGVRQSHYSVPARFIGQTVRVMLHASEVVVFDGRTEIARHERSVTKGSQTLVLDHYLEVLLRKPGALSGSTALAQARESGVFTMAHEAFWAAAKKAHGDADGTRALIDVLLLHRRLPAADVIAGLTLALTAGATSADVVAVEARRARQVSRSAPSADVPAGDSEQRRVVSLTERRLAALPTDNRPLPSVAHYDQLLRRRSAGQPPPSEGVVS